MVIDNTVMGNMYVCHDQVVISYPGYSSPTNSSTIYCTTFTKCIVITYLQQSRLPMIFQVLWILTNRGKLKKVVVLTYGRRALDDHMGLHFGSCTNSYIRTYN